MERLKVGKVTGPKPDTHRGLTPAEKEVGPKLTAHGPNPKKQHAKKLMADG
ncbi:hypothetical protein [Desulforamulus reducens]|uniref:hypothetical protein n=1 Tax=Desulforamulus reducens TaxID=59610 RepID=UPI00031E7E30|nr:hypothetical protein [Desulforamulus reducens]